MTWPDFMGGWLPFELTLERVRFSGRPFRWETGFYVRDVEGLLDGGHVSTSDTPRTRGPGALYTPGERDESRMISIKGFAYAKSMGELNALGQQFGGILPDTEDFAVASFRELGEDRRTTVQRRRQWPFRRLNRTGVARYEMLLRAPDQRIYGDPMKNTGWGATCTVTNRGRYPAPVKIGVRGSAAGGCTVTGPKGRRFTTTRAVVSGTSYVYDADSGVMRVNGSADNTGVTVSDLLEVPPGTHTFTASAGVEILVTGRDTYNP